MWFNPMSTKFGSTNIAVFIILTKKCASPPVIIMLRPL